MCLVSVRRFPTIARRDITCYKVVDRNYNSPMTGFHYEIGKEYTLNKELFSIENERTGYEVHEGFHTFQYLNDAALFGSRWNKTLIYKNKWKGSGEGKIVLECIIPKGAKFFSSPETYLVSDRLKIVSELSKIPIELKYSIK